jgi:hypothetical protein
MDSLDCNFKISPQHLLSNIPFMVIEEDDEITIP